MPRYTDAEITAALEAMAGNVSAAARRLGCERHTIHERVKRSPKLTQLMEDKRQARIDNCESAIDVAIANREPWAVSLTLKMQGKDRGWVDRQEVEQIGKPQVVVYVPDNGRAAPSHPATNGASGTLPRNTR